MKSDAELFIIVIVLSVLWVVGCLIYFNYRNNNPKVQAKSVIEGNIYNKFLPADKQAKNLSINIVYQDKADYDESQFCDIVFYARDFVNKNIKNIEKGKKDIFLSESKIENVHEEKKEVIAEKRESVSDMDFTKFINIANISDDMSIAPILTDNDSNSED
jgi:cellulose synthase/poly-beta-1,6-N-acetylglucosamine synthase-like glycosyltransferase